MSLPERQRSVHFVGIGGIGMSGIAELLLGLGHRVSGSDSQESDVVQRLRKRGARIQIGHNDQILRENAVDVVVYSTAVKASNPELLYARANEIPIIRRAEMLAELMRTKHGIAVAGSHGKTTTTGFTSLLLRAGGLDPTVVIGGKFDAIGSNAALGGGQWMVAEADESDGSFLRLSPEIAIVTNIDREHMDHYGDFETQMKAFATFLDSLPFYGRAILCSDCPHLTQLRPKLDKPRYWYGFEESAKPDFWVVPHSEGANPEFEIFDRRRGEHSSWARIRLSVPGRHNMLNATAAALVAAELGISREVIVKTLAEFRGVSRRFERRGEWQGHPIIEDYAHHPTEIRATLAAGKTVFAPLKPIVLFQPHRFSRTKDLWSDFATCFEFAQKVYSLPIYAASEPREAWVENYDGVNFAKNIKGVPAEFVSSREELVTRLEAARAKGDLAPGTPILVLGAGDISKVIPVLLKG